MIKSKALKSSGRFRWPKDKEPETRLQKIVSKVLDLYRSYLYYPIHGFIFRYHERIGRSLAYAKFGWLNYDFDSACLFDLMAFKLERIHECLKNGHAIQEKESMDALKESIVILNRLSDERYEDKYHKVHDKKWGRIRSKFIPTYNAENKHTGSIWNTSRRKAKTPAQKKKERREFRICWENGEKDREKDVERLNEIFKKYQRSWWD